MSFECLGNMRAWLAFTHTTSVRIKGESPQKDKVILFSLDLSEAVMATTAF